VKVRRRQNAQQHRLALDCACGAVAVLWVHPDAHLLQVAKAHGWCWEAGWICPECRRKQ
jgi:hypothetical protein